MVSCDDGCPPSPVRGGASDHGPQNQLVDHQRQRAQAQGDDDSPLVDGETEPPQRPHQRRDRRGGWLARVVQTTRTDTAITSRPSRTLRAVTNPPAGPATSVDNATLAAASAQNHQGGRGTAPSGIPASSATTSTTAATTPSAGHDGSTHMRMPIGPIAISLVPAHSRWITESPGAAAVPSRLAPFPSAPDRGRPPPPAPRRHELHLAVADGGDLVEIVGDDDQG